MILQRTTLVIWGLSLLLLGSVAAQPYGNEWIDYNQTYYRLRTAQDGMFRLTFEKLSQHQLPLSTADPRQLRVYFRGEEVAVNIVGQEDGVWNAGDYIEFYGQRNTASLDAELRKDMTVALANPYRNLYSDSTSFFFTLGGSGAGKRIASQQLSNPGTLSAEPYHWQEELQFFFNNFNRGITYPYAGSFYTQSSYLDDGEGFTGPVVNSSNNRTFTFPVANVYTAGPAGQVSGGLVGRNNLTRQVPISFGPSTTELAVVHQASFGGQRAYRFSEAVAISRFSGNQAIVRLGAQGDDRYSASYLTVRYPQQWNLNNSASKVFRLPDGGGQRLLSVLNVPAATRVFDITDPANIAEYAGTFSGSTLQLILPSLSGERKLLFTTQFAAVTSGLVQRNFTRWPSSTEFILVTHPALRTSSVGEDPLASYAAYRSSAAGGNYQVTTAEVDQLYDQFSYGEVGPAGIRRFVRYISRNQLPQYLLFLGKSINLDYNYHRSTNWSAANHDYVPTFGLPGADLPYVMNLNGSGNVPAFPVGRVGARTGDELLAYLAKVRETEGASPQNLWKKRVLHLSGGTTQQEANTFLNYLKGFERIAEDPYYGASVKTISKAVDAVVQEIDVSKEVNEGVGLITFFGHSAPSLIDIEIGYVSDPRTNYSNAGRYPAIFVNGCNAGDMFVYNNAISFGEDWILTPNKGAINFIAHTGTGYNNFLRVYGNNFYQIAYMQEENLSLGIGDVQKLTIARFLQDAGVNDITLAQAHQVALQGDPSIPLFGRTQVDYALTDADLSLAEVNGQAVTAAADSFAVQIIARNYGKAVPDSLTVEIAYNEEGTFQPLLIKKLAPLHHQDTFLVKLATAALPRFGNFSFRLSLIAEDNVTEFDLLNNVAYLNTLIPDGSTLNLWPYPFAIVGNNAITLKTQATDILAPARDYTLEASTTADYSGASFVLNGRGYVEQEFALNTAANDTAGFYWRSRIANPTAAEDTSWVTSSFTYLPNAGPGWAQVESNQFAANAVSGLVITGDRQWSYQQVSKTVTAKTYGRQGGSYLDVEVGLDGFQYIIRNIGLNCPNNSIGAVHIDGNTLNTYRAQYAACGRAPQYVNRFLPNDIVGGNNDNYNLLRYLTEIPDGDWVILVSLGRNDYSTWPAEVRAAIENFGLAPGVISSLQLGEPFIFVGKKGSVSGTAAFARATATPVEAQTITLEHTISGAAGLGYVTTDPIGPAKSWTDLEWLVSAATGDTYTLQVIGLDQNGQESTLITKTNEDGRIDLSGISASVYPQLKLVAELRDRVTLTPPQLRFWRVGYQPQPDGTLLAGEEVARTNVLQQGESLQPRFLYRNVSDYNFTADSLAVRSQITAQADGKVQTQQFNIKAPAANSQVEVLPTISNTAQGGKADYALEVNPTEWTERLMANNALTAPDFLTVNADSLNPYIDVAFDGVYIANGDIVSPSARVTVVIRDDNRFAPIQDTTGMQLFLRRMCADCQPEPISLRTNEVVFTPASATQDCKLEFPLENLENGRYVLEVQAADRAGNKAGEKPYAIMFEVVTEKTITNFYPYPNPFSTSTRFVFTLTGSEVPANFKIQILTVTGRVVREIFKEELGPIRIGNNISEYAWNGTDQWGDRLANGVYLYRVIMDAADAGQWEASTRDRANAKAFKDGYGKLYILR